MRAQCYHRHRVAQAAHIASGRQAETGAQATSISSHVVVQADPARTRDGRLLQCDENVVGGFLFDATARELGPRRDSGASLGQPVPTPLALTTGATARADCSPSDRRRPSGDISVPPASDAHGRDVGDYVVFGCISRLRTSKANVSSMTSRGRDSDRPVRRSIRCRRLRTVLG